MKLTGCNWLHTIQPNWYDYSQQKQYDISCMFSYPSKQLVKEHNLIQTIPYDKHREELFETIGNKYKIAGLTNGERVEVEEYYSKMYQSKIIMAPIGYGEMAPRDIESAMFGSILIKPDMSYIDSKPFIYEDNQTYIACKYDWSDLEEKIDYVLSNYDELRELLVQNMRLKYEKDYNFSNIALHLYDVFKNLEGVTV